jgi:hypothetical protein
VEITKVYASGELEFTTRSELLNAASRSLERSGVHDSIGEVYIRGDDQRFYSLEVFAELVPMDRKTFFERLIDRQSGYSVIGWIGDPSEKAYFDATPWFETANDDAIASIAEDTQAAVPQEVVAAATTLDLSLANVNQATTPAVAHVDRVSLEEWIRQERPGLADRLSFDVNDPIRVKEHNAT